MKRYFLLFLVLLSFSSFAQQTINNYKYVLLPEKFDFLKQIDQYKLNSITKQLLEDKGFVVYYDNTDLPDEIAGNKCMAMKLEATSKSSMFSTAITLMLKDCKGNIIFKSKEGKSREKEYDISYNLALRNAFNSFDDINYAYTGAPTAPPVQQPVAAVLVPASPIAAKTAGADTAKISGTLYAQQTDFGYQLIDTAPKIVLTLFKTSANDYFIADKASTHGIVFKKNDNWFFEYYQAGKLIAEKLSIKF